MVRPLEGAARVHTSLGAAKSQIHRLRERRVSTLREQVSGTVLNPDGIDEETHVLCAALIVSEGWLDP
jgi:hypothetical protein